MGYEDLNDPSGSPVAGARETLLQRWTHHEELRHDPIFTIALQKRIGTENEPVILAGKSTSYHRCSEANSSSSTIRN